MLLTVLVFAVSFAATFLAMPVLIRKLRQAKIMGRDVHKASKPEIPEMGGFGIVAGFAAGVLFAVALTTLMHSSLMPGQPFPGISNLTELLAAITTVLIVSLIGIFDDLVSMRHSVKAALPLLAALPLVAVAAGQSSITAPLVGAVHLSWIYPLILVPLAVAVVSNLTNMLAGFNGLEAGMGLMACTSLGAMAFVNGKVDAAILLISMSGALFAFLFFNRYPAKIFTGDVGTLSIGACIASSVIIGNFETAGIIIMSPYILDFIIKAKNGFPKELDVTRLEGGKLKCSKVVGLPSLIMRLTGGISEVRLVMALVSLEAVLGILTILLW